jgi:hypothetical protein
MKTQRVLITAAATGIGRAIADGFVDSGARVHICDISDAHLEACLNKVPGMTGTAADVANLDDVERIFEEALQHLGGLDVLVNNAGIAGPTGRVEDIDPEAWLKTFDVNIHGQFYMARQAIPLLKASDFPSIINISTTAGLMGYPFRSPYCASKWAVIGLTKTLAMELGEFGIRANVICPGTVDGPRMDGVIAREAGQKGLSEADIRDAYKLQTSLRTFIDGSDIADMAVFLASPAAKKITGQTLSVDGHIEMM